MISTLPLSSREDDSEIDIWYKRFLRWAERGVWDRLFDDLVADEVD
jgi:hypothetical protein